MQLSIIIVSYNTSPLLKACLDSVFASSFQDFEVIVVDNHSSDDSTQMVQREFPQVKLLQNSSNPGFGSANNQGAQIAQGSYLLFLNSDTVVEPHALKELLGLAKKAKAPIASCTLVNSDGSIQSQGGALPNLVNLTAWMLFIDDLPFVSRLILPYQQSHPDYFTQNRQMGWVAGTALLIKRHTFHTLGGFNPKIFMYGEDVELCYRASLHGFNRFFFAKPRILHLGQGSGNSTNAYLGEFKGLLYLFKHYRPAWQYRYLQLVLKLGALLRLVIFGIIGRDETKKDAYRQALKLA
jgi:N-acetylglucosaminyl-diphospho-decaprenol L-rhamnosyltransferase